MLPEWKRALEAALIRDQDSYFDARRKLASREHLLGIRQLRNDIRAHERRQLDPVETCAAEQLDEPELVGGRDHLGLVLEAVARPDLADAHALGERVAHAASMPEPAMIAP